MFQFAPLVGPVLGYLARKQAVKKLGKVILTSNHAKVTNKTIGALKNTGKIPPKLNKVIATSNSLVTRTGGITKSEVSLIGGFGLGAGSQFILQNPDPDGNTRSKVRTFLYGKEGMNYIKGKPKRSMTWNK